MIVLSSRTSSPETIFQEARGRLGLPLAHKTLVLIGIARKCGDKNLESNRREKDMVYEYEQVNSK